MSIREFIIDPDIRRASTLPAAVYHEPPYYALQKDRVFARSWQFIPGAERVKAPGHVLPFTLLEGCLDEPLVLVAGDDDVTRCLSNVCTHRGTLVVEGEGHTRSLRCRYHGRRFGLDGCFVSRSAGDTFRQIAHDLTAAGHKTKQGGRWHPATVRDVWQAWQRYRAILSGEAVNATTAA